MYTEKELVGIAKRENNQKRKYLVVNYLQGKHVPVSPGAAFAMFDELADLVGSSYEKETLLLVGFAETATAIGAALAAKLDTLYMQTTRENIPGVEYLFFSEAHSHATEQKLIKTDLDRVMDKIDRIVFVEDEVTTGNTILNIIRILEKTYPKKIHFSVASLLNGMNQEAEQSYAKRDIRTHYLVKTNHDFYTDIAETFKGDGDYHSCSGMGDTEDIISLEISGCLNARRLNRGLDYQRACEKLWEDIAKKTDLVHSKKILVLGTEECMYPALFTAKKLEETGKSVRCHSTTRSPIVVSKEGEYPLHVRYELASLYDKNRRTFLYDLNCYEEVLIVTDADNQEKEGIRSLVQAIRSCGNQKIYFIRWC